MTEQEQTKEKTAVGAFLSAMHDQGLDGAKVREAMLEVLGITAANAVSHPKTETAPAPESRAITSESAANAMSAEPLSKQLEGKDYPADWLEFADKMQAAKAVQPKTQERRDPLDLGQYVNDAHISANDKPVAVIEKLQAVINERTAHHGK